MIIGLIAIISKPKTMLTQITIQISPDELQAMIKSAVSEALNHSAQYEKQFDELPDKINQTQAAAFLKVDISTVRRWRESSKLQFVHNPGKNPFISKRQFIQDCRKHNLK